MSEKERRIFRRLEDESRHSLYVKTPEGLSQVGEIRPERRGFDTRKGRPDFVVWIALNLRLLGTITRVEFPVLVEEEGGGIDSATEDYQTFLRTEGLRMPMIIVGGDKRDSKIKHATCSITVDLSQIPYSYIFPA